MGMAEGCVAPESTLPSSGGDLFFHPQPHWNPAEFQLPLLSETWVELTTLFSGLTTPNCSLDDLKDRFNYLYDQHKKNFTSLTHLIDLCCPFYAAKLCLAEQHPQIRDMHMKLASAPCLHQDLEEARNKCLFIAGQMMLWGDYLLTIDQSPEAEQMFLCAFEIIDNSLASRPTQHHFIHPLQIHLLERLGDIHSLSQNYPEAMKYHFSVLFHVNKQKLIEFSPIIDKLHVKMIKNYHSFLAQLGVTEFDIPYIEIAQPNTKTIRAIGNELLIQQKFEMAAKVFSFGKEDLKAEYANAILLKDGKVEFNGFSYSLPWVEQQLTLQSIREEMQTLQGVEAQNETTKRYIALLHELFKKSIVFLGAPPYSEIDMGTFTSTEPTRYTIIGLGSMGHGGMARNSDLEFAILVKETTPEVVEYFAKVTQLVEMHVIFCGETSPRPEDERFRRGFSFDEKGNTPLGAGNHRQGLADVQQGQDCNERNIKTPKEMALIISPKDQRIENLISCHGLCYTNLAFGDETLFQTFLKERELCLDASARHITTQAFITETLTFAPSLYKMGKLNVKKDLYRMLSFLILGLAHYHNVDFELLIENPSRQLSLFDRLKKLEEIDIIDATSTAMIRRALNLAANLRNRAHTFYENEREDVYEHPDAHHFSLQDQTELLEVYHNILIPIRKYAEHLNEALYDREPPPPLDLSKPMTKENFNLIKVQIALMKGDTTSFQAISAKPEVQADIINTFDFSKVTPANQTRILLACVNMRVEKLILRGCSPDVDFSELLEGILVSTGKKLIHLDITHSQGLTSTAIIAKHCLNLKELILDDILTLHTIESEPKKFLGSPTFTKLGFFSAKRCMNLKEIVGLPHIRNWSLEGSPDEVAHAWFASDKNNRKGIQTLEEKLRFLGLAVDEGNLEAKNSMSFLKKTPEMAFGTSKWITYIGNPGLEPPFIVDIQSILAGPCPIHEGKTFAETHVFFLDPKDVDGTLFTFELIVKLSKKPKKGKKSDSNIWPVILKEFGKIGVEKSRLICMTREAVPGTIGKAYEEQCAILAGYNRGPICYRAPKLREAFEAISTEQMATGNRLYGPNKFTRCSEKTKSGCYTAVGNFGVEGIEVRTHIIEKDNFLGLAGCWELY